MDKLAELRRKLGALTDDLNSAEILADGKAFDAKEAEIVAVEAEIRRVEAARARSASLAQPVSAAAAEPDPNLAARAAQGFNLRAFNGGGECLSPANYNPVIGRQFESYVRSARAEAASLGLTAKDLPFKSFGEQLQAIARSTLATKAGGTADPRLVRAPTGASEVDPTGGGFLAQVDFQQAVFMLAHDMGEILSRVNKIPISAEANGLKINAVDETSRATGSRWGGVQSYWVGEGTQPSSSKPKFRRAEFDLKKLFSLAYMTDELLQDSTALTAILGQAFAEEIMFMTEDSVFEGTGAGQPLGILNSTALVSVAKAVGQPTATIVKENVDAMWSRLWSRSRKNSVWLVNQDALPQLMGLAQVVGTGGAPVYLPPGGYSGSPYSTLLGRPVIETEYSAALGSPGDIVLVDLSQYTLVDKGGVQAATSMHIAFLTDEMVFRITYRTDGQPMWKSPITPFKGGNTRSPFVAIAAR
ncbi:HK97 family phage major capsid protein [Roseiarcus fermentans]|uniref:HK97 family phage major capsid protein n=1 Tax=Roseiarcus fermentans TaxID=1473586 RepID=A0A366EPB4_9HYPH|nr:phage major capsid protein [Roseiarcus fermentans]RBP03816.1 HK97 family phage major capsid protein [Roseiarcus fermentans]